MVATLGYIAISAGISYLSARLFQQQQEPINDPFDDKPTPTARHGAYLPLVIGRRRVVPLFAWVGDRATTTTTETVGKASGQEVTTTNYTERAWHTLCIGPVDKLHAIISNGERVFEGPITPTTDPSGSTITIPSFGAFKPYWGEDAQPIDPLISANVAASRYPRIASAVWGEPGGSTGKILGQIASWPSMEYEIEVRVNDSPLTASPSWIEESAVDAGDEGVNPAHALWQLLCKPYPYGAGIPEQHVNLSSLEALGELCVDEHLAVNILASGGVNVATVIGWLLADLSTTLVQVGQVLTVIPVRADATPPTLTEDILIPPRPEIQFTHGRRRADREIFEFQDQTNNYKVQDIAVDDDGAAEQYGVPKARKINLRTVTHPLIAATVVDRRQLEEQVLFGSVRLRAARGARVILPGQAFVAEGVGALRCLSVKLNDSSSQVEIEAAFDNYAPGPTGYEPPEPGINIPDYPVEEDANFTFHELPYRVAPEGTLSIGVLRVRENSTIQQARTWLSATGTTYQETGNQDKPTAGGPLTEAWPKEASAVTEVGPAFTADNLDIGGVLNLTGDDENWLRGRQVLVLDDQVSGVHEICYLRNVEALGGSSYRLRGIVRARYDTKPQDFPIGARVFIFQWSDVVRAVDPLIVLGSDLYLKVQPYSGIKTVDLGTITAVSKTIAGRSLRPLPTDNLRANDDGSHPVNEYSTGGDVLFKWTYRVRDGAGDAAGEQLAGIEISGKPPHDGFFRLEIVDTSGPTVVRTFDIDSDTTQQNYTNAQLQTDFSGEPASFEARVRNVDGAFASDNEVITVTKV